jgi:hypothetical protein
VKNTIRAAIVGTTLILAIIIGTTLAPTTTSELGTQDYLLQAYAEECDNQGVTTTPLQFQAGLKNDGQEVIALAEQDGINSKVTINLDWLDRLTIEGWNDAIQHEVRHVYQWETIVDYVLTHTDDDTVVLGGIEVQTDGYTIRQPQETLGALWLNDIVYGNNEEREIDAINYAKEN